MTCWPNPKPVTAKAIPADASAAKPALHRLFLSIGIPRSRTEASYIIRIRRQELRCHATPLTQQAGATFPIRPEGRLARIGPPESVKSLTDDGIEGRSEDYTGRAR